MMLSRRIRFSLSLFLLAALGWAGAAQAQSPTPVTSIVNSNQDTTLQVGYNGSLLMPGTVAPIFAAPDSIPAEGKGTRMMWYPAKAAFRAGRVGVNRDGTQWNAANVGSYSVAFGLDTEASENAATAMGNRTTASGKRATAMGNRTTASGFRTTAMGNNTTASGQIATAMGNQTTASGPDATAMGDNTIAATNNSLSIGRFNSANTSDDSTLFVAGNGGVLDRSDALVLDQSGDLTISGTLTESSDRRLKKDIQPLRSDVLRRLSELRPVRYRFEDESTHPSGEQVGLIAQDVRKEFPSLVSKGASGYLSLAYPKMTAVLLKGIQQQQATIDSLRRQVRSLREVRQTQKRLAQQVTALKQQKSSALPAGWGPTALLALLLGGCSFGAGLLWRRRT
jgi:hypothetical protein